MKNILVASLISLALATVAGCRSHMQGMTMQGMGQRSLGKSHSSANTMMGHMPGHGTVMKMMPCCEQCPMMKEVAARVGS
jgi:hypothetical protein